MHASIRHLLKLSAMAWFMVRSLRHRRHHGHLRGAAPGCMVAPLSWRGANGELRVNDQVFHLKGTNWYGFETEKSAVQGLDVRTMDELLIFLRDNRFNALRMPFSLKFALAYDDPVEGTEAFLDADLHGMTRRQLLNRVVEKAAEYGLLVMLDMHRLNDAFIPQLWYDEEHSMDDVLLGWDTVLGDLKGHWNVFAVDLKNEPSGVAQWGDGSNPDYDWNIAAEQIGRHLLETHADWQGLVFVEGVNFSTDFRGFREHPLDFGNPDWNARMVLSPHQYGPSVSHSNLFQDPSFPENLPPVWTEKWAFLKTATSMPVVIGEWGGKYFDKDKIWQDYFADFLLENCLNDQFTWDLNPTSADTGGLLLSDWTTPETAKLAVVARVQPDPSTLTQDKDAGKVCLTNPGSYATPACAPKRRA